MDILWGSDIAHCFITNVGLVTTHGIHGHNIMACEWTFHLSYKPGLIGIGVNPRHATHLHIKDSKEFGVCIASVQQARLASIAGRESGRRHDKIKIAEALGFTFYPAKNINVLLVDGASANIECKLFREVELGDHTLFVGEVLDATVNPGTKPLAYHNGNYWDLTSSLEKPAPEMREKIKALFEQYVK